MDLLDIFDLYMLRKVSAQSLTLYALMTPPAVLSAFISATGAYSGEERSRTAYKTSMAIFIIGVVLFLFGSSLFDLFGFTLDAFRIGAGILLFLTAVSLMNDKPDHDHSQHEGDISVVPLAIPLGMGPASIGAVMVLGASATDVQGMVIGVLSLALAAFGMYLLLRMSGKVLKALGHTGIAVLSKLTGLLLSAIAAQVVFTGISAFL